MNIIEQQHNGCQPRELYQMIRAMSLPQDTHQAVLSPNFD